jgi:hypothetical protein
MTRRIGAFCALALTLAAAPAASATPPRGEIVIVADGHATGSVTLPVAVDVLAGGATYETDSPYVVFGFLRDGSMKAGTDWYDGGEWMFPLVYPGEVAAGTTTVRVLTEGPTTIRVPVDGISGTTTITLTTPLAGAVGEVVDVPFTGNTAHSEVPVTLAPDALTLHAWHAEGGTVAGHARVMCVAALPCADPGVAVGRQTDRVDSYWPWDGLSGPVTARLVIADAGVPGTLRQFVLSMPLT